MNYVELYRLEDAGGTGVYNADAVQDMKDYPHRPRTEDDGLPCAGELQHLHFAFADLNAVTAWFDEDDLEHMLNYDIQCSVYRVPLDDVMYGTRQCAFDRTNAQLVQIIDLESFALEQECVA